MELLIGHSTGDSHERKPVRPKVGNGVLRRLLGGARPLLGSSHNSDTVDGAFNRGRDIGVNVCSIGAWKGRSFRQTLDSPYQIRPVPLQPPQPRRRRYSKS